ncbi:hypothetical protein ACSQ67_003119 [Phaseolus vulgaris]
MSKEGAHGRRWYEWDAQFYRMSTSLVPGGALLDMGGRCSHRKALRVAAGRCGANNTGWLVLSAEYVGVTRMVLGDPWMVFSCDVKTELGKGGRMLLPA